METKPGASGGDGLEARKEKERADSTEAHSNSERATGQRSCKYPRDGGDADHGGNKGVN